VENPVTVERYNERYVERIKCNDFFQIYERAS
jgi:hypothetical protein